MVASKGRTRGVAQVLPLFSPAFENRWQLILPRDRLVVYHPDREQ